MKAQLLLTPWGKKNADVQKKPQQTLLLRLNAESAAILPQSWFLLHVSWQKTVR